jgi:serine/threonine-protein kinase
MGPGQAIAHYRITSKLGAGGMGEVWRATDTKLGRDVAIKILPAAFGHDTERIARFEREAQVLAALNHPNIAAIYGVEDRAIVMELVEGETLAGPLPVETALNYARQITEGLEAAHDKGIVHRDLKPANIKITPEGVVKVLDFGLAKLSEDPIAPADGTNSPTLTMQPTGAGWLLGTAAYMAPEQARGKPIDRRADIWAFGVVLYEMLSGRQLFGGETVSDSLAAVITKEPDWAALPKDTPARIRCLLERCLRKEPKKRLQAIGEARIAIDEDQPEPLSVPAPYRRPWLPWLVAAMLGMTLLATPFLRRVAPVQRPLIRLSIELGSDAALARGAPGDSVALSPDGTRLVFVMAGADGKRRLASRRLDQKHVTLLSDNEVAGHPFFSPDSQWIAFFADHKLKKISVQGGAAVTLCEISGYAGPGGSWGDDGNLVVALTPVGGLSLVSSAGGPPKALTVLDYAEGERTHRWPQTLPENRGVLFTTHGAIGRYDDANIVVLSLQTGQRKTVQRGGFLGRYLASGHLVYIHQNTLFAVPFDLKRLAVAGMPVPLLDDVSTSGTAADFSFSQTGAFVYLSGSAAQSLRSENSIVWLDSSGKTQPLQQRQALYAEPRFSPDGKRLAYSIASGNGADIWVQDVGRDTPSRLTFLPGYNSLPAWSPEGKYVFFTSSNPAGPGIYWVRADGSGETQRLTDGRAQEVLGSISPDGKRLAMVEQTARTGADIWTAPIDLEHERPRLGTPEPFLQTEFSEIAPEFSPDGRWLAYTSNESGSTEVYVRPFPGPGGRTQVSSGGGMFPMWARNRQELFFLSGQRLLMVASYTVNGGGFKAEEPRIWSQRVLNRGAWTTFFAGFPTHMFGLAPDGKRFAVALPLGDIGEQKPLTHVTLLLNFFDELRRRVPGGDQ